MCKKAIDWLQSHEKVLEPEVINTLLHPAFPWQGGRIETSKVLEVGHTFIRLLRGEADPRIEPWEEEVD